MENKNNFFSLTVKAVVINEKNEVLLLKRPADDEYGAGKWDLPGGNIEKGENIEEALIREIKEEIGAKVEIGPVIYAFDFEKKYAKSYEVGKEKFLIGGKGIRFIAFCKSEGVKLSKEHDVFKWVGFSEALGMFGTEDFEKDKKISIEKAQEYLEKKSALDNWKRTLADFENYKKRQAEEKTSLIAFSNLNLILEILPVLDNFHASTEHIPEDQKENPWVVGIMHIQKQLEKVLEDNGVKEIAIKEGDEFDPAAMEAIKQESKGDKQESEKNTVEKILMKGYKLGGKIIRAAKVVVK